MNRLTKGMFSPEDVHKIKTMNPGDSINIHGLLIYCTTNKNICIDCIFRPRYNEGFQSCNDVQQRMESWECGLRSWRFVDDDLGE